MQCFIPKPWKNQQSSSVRIQSRYAATLTLLRKEGWDPVRLKEQLGLGSQNALFLSQGSHVEQRCGGLQKRLWNKKIPVARSLLAKKANLLYPRNVRITFLKGGDQE